MEKFKNFFAGTNRRLRITTAIIMLSLAYFIVKIGYWGVCSLGLVLALAMIYEFDKMFNKKLGFKFVWDSISIVGVLTAFCLNRIMWNLPNYYFSSVLIGLFCFSMLVNIALDKKHWFLESIPSVYIGFGIMSLLYAYLYSSIVAVLYMFIITISTDSGAYLIGSALGGPKIWPKISPKKTWSGSIGGTLCAFGFGTSFIIAILWKEGMDNFYPIALWGMISIILSICSQLGDFFESWLKRLNDIKDSSNLIPGHGGFLDRFDSILFVAPIIALIIGFTKIGMLIL